MGRQVVVSHAKGKTHIRILKIDTQLPSQFLENIEVKNKPQIESVSVSTLSHSSLESFCTKDDVT